MGSSDSLLKKIIFTSKEHGKITFHETEESDASSGMLSVKATGAFGSIEFREIREEGYSFRFGSLDIAEDMTLTTILDIPYLGILINLGNNVGYSQEGIRSGTLKKNQGRIISLPYLHIKSKLYKGLSYSVFGILLSAEYLKNWEKAFPVLSRLLSKVHKDIPVFDQIDVNDSPGIAAIVTDIKSRTENSEHSRLYRRNRINDLLLNIFELYESGISIVLSSVDIEKLYQVHDFLIQNPEEYSISLKKLSQDVGMNVFKLKNGFKKLFGMPVFKFFLEVRLQKAKELLAERNKPINEIAALVGYKNVSSFCAAFKKRFGYPPGALR